MKLSKRSAVLIATGVTGAMALSACGGGSDSGGGDGGSGGSGRVVYGESTDWPENLMPLISAGNALSVANIEAQLLPQAYLVQPDLSVKYDDQLLTEEPTSEVAGDTQTVTYKINPDANWSDGEPITADDFEFSWNLQKSSDPAQGGCETLLSTTGYDKITSVEGADEGKTVTVTLSPFADWKALFSGSNNPVFPKHVMDQGSPEANCAYLSTGWPIADGLPQDISGGPWQLKKSNINNGQQIAVLTPNENYWGDKPKLDQLVIQGVGNDPTTQVQGLKSGELNVIYPQPQLDLVGQVDALKPNVESDVNFGITFEHLDFNTTDPQLSDVRVRQAIAMALDRQEIVDQTVGQFSSDAQVLNNRIWLNTQEQYQDNAPEQYKTADVAGAKALLEQAGYTLGSDGIYAKGSQRLSFKIDTTANNPLREQTINVMIPQLKAAGVEASFNANPDIFAGPDKPTSLVAGGFQMALFAWVGSPFISTTPPIYQSPEGAGGAVQQNYSRTGTPEIDALLTQWLSETEESDVAATGNEIDKALWDQMATLPLYQKPTYIAYSSNVSGVEDNPTQAGPLWNASTWTVQ
ncbi:ABC transporter family substrate-binding protein [Modestobacter excelsi]|uniref:ABC transporter family substrate-binding protein n=1 Tax=Modestobacter excelsi TaxID=2213161 RepID=UPI00110D15AF|nr:ABC transporter family substrate-binding protein [Modestobacter excelsi]